MVSSIWGLNGCRGNSGAHPPTYLGGTVGSYFGVKAGMRLTAHFYAVSCTVT